MRAYGLPKVGDFYPIPTTNSPTCELLPGKKVKFRLKTTAFVEKLGQRILSKAIERISGLENADFSTF